MESSGLRIHGLECVHRTHGSELIERKGTVLVHFVRLHDNDRPGLWYRPRPSARRGRYKGHLEPSVFGFVNLSGRYVYELEFPFHV